MANNPLFIPNLLQKKLVENLTQSYILEMFMPAFSQRHYEKFAGVFQAMLIQAREARDVPKQIAVADVVLQTAKMFAEDDPNFIAMRFYMACGYGSLGPDEGHPGLGDAIVGHKKELEQALELGVTVDELRTA